MIKLKHYRVVFTTVYTRMSPKIFQNPLLQLSPYLLIPYARLFICLSLFLLSQSRWYSF
jgi:hypothetical protein